VHYLAPDLALWEAFEPTSRSEQPVPATAGVRRGMKIFGGLAAVAAVGVAVGALVLAVAADDHNQAAVAAKAASGRSG